MLGPTCPSRRKQEDVDSSGERAQCPSTKSRKCWAGPGGEQACGTDTEAFEQRKSKWRGSGVLIITGTGKSRGYGEVHSRGWLENHALS